MVLESGPEGLFDERDDAAGCLGCSAVVLTLEEGGLSTIVYLPGLEKASQVCGKKMSREISEGHGKER